MWEAGGGEAALELPETPTQTSSTVLTAASIREITHKTTPCCSWHWAFSGIPTWNSIFFKISFPFLVFLYHLVLRAAFCCRFLFCPTPNHLEKWPHPRSAEVGSSGSPLCLALPSPYFRPSRGLTSAILSSPLISCICNRLPAASRFLIFPLRLSSLFPPPSLLPFSYPLPLTDRFSYYILFFSSPFDFSCSVGSTARDLACLPPNADFLELVAHSKSKLTCFFQSPIIMLIKNSFLTPQINTTETSS